MKGRRDLDAFARERDNQKALQAMAGAGLIDLCHFGEPGFATVPSVPYAWQPVGTALDLPSFKSKRLDVPGFLSKGRHAFLRHAEGPGDTGQVVAASRHLPRSGRRDTPSTAGPAWSMWTTPRGTSAKPSATG